MNNKKITIKNMLSGFTMIELLIVIVIIGILSTIGLRTFASSQMKARDSKRKTDLRTIGDALEVYYNDNGGYPVGVGGAIVGCDDDEGAIVACTPGQIWDNLAGTTYMVQMPEDPSGGSYHYVSADGSSYQIYARLENDRDRDVPKDVDDDPLYYTTPGDDACTTGNCNYGKSSTNIDLGATN